MKRCLRILTGFFVVFGLCLSFPPSARAITVAYSGPDQVPVSVPTMSLPSNPDFPDLENTEFNLETFYTATYGMNPPNSMPRGIFAESQDRFVLLMGTRSGVDVFQKFSLLFTGSYWTVKADIELNPATAVIFDPNDEVSMRGTIQHKLSADGIPHPGDDANGPVIPYELVLNAGQKMPHPTLGLPFQGVGTNFLKVAEHPHAGHGDVALGAGFASVFTGSGAGIDFFDEIGSWTVVVGGQHAVIPEPASLILFSSGLAGAGLIRKKKGRTPNTPISA